MTEKLRPSVWRRFGNSWRHYRRGFAGTFDLLPDGFIFTNHRKPVTIRWDEIVQIDAGVRDYLTIDVFFAVIHTARTNVEIDELVDGFRQMESYVLERWPNVKARWHELQSGAPHQPHYESLWRRAG